MKTQFYQSEFLRNKKVILSITAVITLSYLVYLFNEKTVVFLCSEDNLFEGGTALLLLLSSILFFIASRKNVFMILLGLVFFFGAGEEISWGQRIIGFKVPENIKKENVQEEFNIHNLPTFNGTEFKGTHQYKTGWQRLTEMNFLYRVFLMSFGIILPLLTFHVSFVNKLVKKLKIPVPPVSLGIFFLISWIVNKSVLYCLAPGHQPDYYFGTSEIWEFCTSVVLFCFGLYFYNNRKKPIFGYDIKETDLIQSPQSESTRGSALLIKLSDKKPINMNMQALKTTHPIKTG